MFSVFARVLPGHFLEFCVVARALLHSLKFVGFAGQKKKTNGPSD